MKYLVLGCDPVGDHPLWEENELHGSTFPVSLPSELIRELLAWNEQMAGAVQAATESTSAIARLNAEGESLAERVANTVTGGVKVRYLSE